MRSARKALAVALALTAVDTAVVPAVTGLNLASEEVALATHEAAPDVVLEPPRLERKTLDRWPDPVLVDGDLFPSFLGKPLAGLRLYAFRDGQPVPIPFQVDERTSDGRKVLSCGPEQNAGEANGLFDACEELVFMARDSGDRASPALADLPRGASIRQEICVEDPLAQGRGWVYLLFFPGDAPPLCSARYVEYDRETNTNWSRYYVAEDISWTRGGKRYDTIYYKAFNTPPFAGGTGVDFVDRLKTKIDLALFWGAVHVVFTHEDMIGQNVSWQAGPVRITRRVWTALKLPMGLRSPRFDVDILQYDTLHTCPLMSRVPVRPKRVGAKVEVRMGTDLNRDAFGMMWYNSLNLEGFLVDGRMSPQELAMDRGVDRWRVVTGRHGTILWRALWDEDYLRQIHAEVVYVDDIGALDPPEFEPGQVGAAYIRNVISDVRPGSYLAYMEFYHPPHFLDPKGPVRLNTELLRVYLNIQDHPVHVIVDGTRRVSRIRSDPP